MANRFGQRRLADAERLRGDGDSAALQRPHREAESLVHRTEDLTVGDLDIEFEVHAAETADAERVGARRASDAGGIHRHDERRDALPAQVRPRRREDDGDGGDVGVRDPHFASGDVIPAAGLDGFCLLIGGIGSRVRLRKRKGADRLAACETPQPFFFLRRLTCCASSSATSEFVTDSATATVALALAIASIASAYEM